ncbi:MAG: hypothetical protein ACQEP3_01730 [Patescibacteria group bacterium]
MRLSNRVEQKQWEQVRGLLQQKEKLEAVLNSDSNMSEQKRRQKEIELGQLERRLEKSKDLTKRVL